MLSISCSTGIVSGANFWSAEPSSGVCMGVLEFGGKNPCGYFGKAISVPAATGETISGVTITMSSELFLVRDIVWKNFPRIGMSPRKGIFYESIVFGVIEQSADREALMIGEFDFSFYTTDRDRGLGKAGDGDCIGKVKRADFG